MEHWAHERKLLSNSAHLFPCNPAFLRARIPSCGQLWYVGMWEFSPYNPLPLESGQEHGSRGDPDVSESWHHGWDLAPRVSHFSTAMLDFQNLKGVFLPPLRGSDSRCLLISPFTSWCSLLNAWASTLTLCSYGAAGALGCRNVIPSGDGKEKAVSLP